MISTIEEMNELIMDDEDIVTESMFDIGFNNLRMKLAQALEGRFNVTNVVKGMLGKNKFDVIDDTTESRTTVESLGNGCKAVTWTNDGRMKCHFNNISLSQAFDKLMSIFNDPHVLLEYSLEQKISFYL